MLNEKERDIIKETVPVLQQKGEEITSYFYNRMFTRHPELKNMFNQTNQKKGLQSTALAQSVLAAAVNIDDLTRIMPVVKEIAYKHCALQVPEAGYDIVGENLLAAIQNVLDLPEDDVIIATWAKAYGEIASVFINVEKEIYNDMAWDGFKPFKITHIEAITSDIKMFTVKSDEYDLSKFEAGEYITVDVESDKLEYRAKRHYSIIEGDKHTLTFAVKRDVTDSHEGEVSTILHDEMEVGDTIDLSAPVGVFGIVNDTAPQLFIGSGIGVTPLIPMFNDVAKSNVKVDFIQNVESVQEIPFTSRIEHIVNNSDNASYIIHDKQKSGYMDATYLSQFISTDTEIYVCGGVKFLQSIITTLKEIGVEAQRIHFESFIPRLSVGV
ncbi:globin domain-containing protein [Staphylococcus pseudoxylosus]|uniref:globin domain-containing protein n=1 Tax=Staphylococcus pseudoxylosus TaxID=2282419 RepID=UPI000D1D5750|nr:globin domain-containing protein [Staphylococcus pseudoxylosus]PTI46666.1 nitric oxide dioxygenase [Staphylococcus xylosus]MDW8799161.1 globin domain-containing protein [Staphylococcus pseudoxylosus]MEB6035440.1 globin domain-containing protein [Staphylococcus pseudoxylosus]MEB6044724.1 globin domain-containing protein [Staphylococcus pseudoxylosus]MEB7765199.1 globin domain-containing protein [Staphylococcus pseudoxylosus]